MLKMLIAQHSSAINIVLFLSFIKVKYMSQTTSTLLMIRPVGFSFNEQTASTNAFQRSESRREDAQERALKEFNQMVKLLRDNDIKVITIEDTVDPHTPDSIFPNNWISTHEEGLVVVYPMHAQNRRYERRADIVQTLAEQFVMYDIVDFSASENENKFLEGTGSMVLDRDARICYACYSPRTDKELLEKFCNKMGYEMIAFNAVDQQNNPIYHTNVIMCVGEQFMVVCLECIPNKEQQHILIQSTSKQIIPISYEQMNHFAGNMLEVVNTKKEHLLVMSTTAYQSLKPEQITQLEKYVKILHSPIPTIEEHGGGSTRCMMAEIFLPAKTRG